MLNLPEKINLKRSHKNSTPSNLTMYYAWKNIKKSYENNELKISALTWDEEFELPYRSYPVSNI